ncbi:hypothetical protein QTP88_024330 [Uroleucon formosanum]
MYYLLNTGFQQSNQLPKAGVKPTNALNQPAKLSAGHVSRLSLPRVPIINEDKKGLYLKRYKINYNTTNKNFKSEKCILKPQRKHKVIKENRINYRVDGEDDDVELDNSIKLFQRLLRGRAYQTMMIMAKIRYQPILHSNEKPVTLDTANKFKKITCVDVLENARKKHISRFFDTLYNESILLNDIENKNNMLIQQGNLSRIEFEMAERKQRQIEITARIEQDEILRQVLNIHEQVSVLFCEKIMEEAIQQTAKEESLKATMKSCKNKFYNIESDRNIASDLMSNFIIPLAHRVISGEREYPNN